MSDTFSSEDMVARDIPIGGFPAADALASAGFRKFSLIFIDHMNGTHPVFGRLNPESGHISAYSSKDVLLMGLIGDLHEAKNPERQINTKPLFPELSEYDASALFPLNEELTTIQIPRGIALFDVMPNAGLRAVHISVTHENDGEIVFVGIANTVLNHSGVLATKHMPKFAELNEILGQAGRPNDKKVRVHVQLPTDVP